MEFNNKDIDQNKANRLHSRVYGLERQFHSSKNTKNSKMTESELVNKIIKLISDEVENDN